uniref:hypothetical protein n=1 Tax=Marinobacterium profundum TaxID=1714300 RepID=UPI000A4526F6|nr:hypothetical protein [Marinobacterium profundum]
MKIRLLSAGVLALSLIASPSRADVDVGIFFSGAAIHGNGFSLYLGGPYSYAPYGYIPGRSRHYVPHRHYTPPRHHYRPRHYDRSPGYWRHDYRGHGDGRRRFEHGRSSHRSGGDYRQARSGAWRDGNRQFFRSGDGRRH